MAKLSRQSAADPAVSLPLQSSARLPLSGLALLAHVSAQYDRPVLGRHSTTRASVTGQPLHLSKTPVRFLARPRVEYLTGYSTASIYRLMSAGQFPQCYELGANKVGWKESEILEWCESRKPRRRKDGSTTQSAAVAGECDE